MGDSARGGDGAMVLDRNWIWLTGARGPVETPGGQHAVAGGDVEVARPRILREIPGLTPSVDLAGVRQTLAGQHLQRRGLAGAVPADQTDPIPALNAQRGVGEQDARAGAQLKAGNGDH